MEISQRVMKAAPSVATRCRISLFDLPPELIFCISEHLPVSSAALLALCSKSLLRILGLTYFRLIERGRKASHPWPLMQMLKFTEIQAQRNEFLSLLERDCYEVVFCYYCQKLHAPALHNLGVSGPTCPDIRVAWGPSTNGLIFSRLYYAMKRYRKGFDVKDLLDPISLPETRYLDNLTHQRLFTPRVISGRLYLRTQHWILLPPDRPLAIPRGCYHTEVCNHFSTVSTYDHDRGPLTQIIVNTLEAFKQAYLDDQQPTTNEVQPAALTQCEFCNTEFQVNIKDMEELGTAVVITTWKNFGEVLTPFDMTWKTHTEPPPYVWHTRGTPAFERGSIKQAFEGDHFDFAAHQTKPTLARLYVRRLLDWPGISGGNNWIGDQLPKSILSDI